MRDPTVTADSNSYDKLAIPRWVEEHNKSPLIKLPLKTRLFFENLTLKRVIDKFRAQLPFVQSERQIMIDLEEPIKLRKEMVSSYLAKNKDSNFKKPVNEENNTKEESKRTDKSTAQGFDNVKSLT